MLPEDLKYTAEHEWVRDSGDGPVRIGITDFAQDALGDIVYVALPSVGERIEAGSPVGELESTKSVSDLFAPLAGTVSAVNGELSDNPELCNTDPYGEGWLVEITVGADAGAESLLSAADYEATVTSQ